MQMKFPFVLYNNNDSPLTKHVGVKIVMIHLKFKAQIKIYV